MPEVIEKPLVSVVVPVHNAGVYLRECLDSLVFQTLQQIEIIVIENGSTDDTLQILDEYKTNFPDKMVVKSIPPVETSAEGRSLGFHMARADYVYSCDGDDIVDLRALELLYKKAIEGGYDIVGGRSYTYTDTHLEKISARLPEEMSIGQYIICQNPSFWSRLVKKSLLERCGDVPTTVPLSDVAYVLPLSSYAKKVGFINWPPIYHYFRRYGSEVNTAFSKTPLDIISPERIALAQCNPAYREEMICHIVNRIYRNLRFRWHLQDMIIPWLRELWPEIEKNHYVRENQTLYKKLEGYINLPSPPMPEIIYVNGFSGDGTAEKKFKESETPIFYNLQKIEVLNRTNCDVGENRMVEQAYQDGNYEFVAHYFALKQIYENGGVYLHENIGIDAPLNYLRYRPCFFGYIDQDTYSDWIFGGQKGNQVLKDILDTYEEGSIYNERHFSLRQRIKSILWENYGIAPDGRTSLKNMQVCLLGPEVIFCCIEPKYQVYPKLHLCRHEKYHDLDEEMITISAKTIRTLIRNQNRSSAKNSELQMQEELKRIKSSNSWKVVKKIQKLGDGPMGPFLKKIFHTGIKFYRKFLKR